MGTPKALLPAPTGTPFVLAQLHLLADAGCAP
ncbi:MAG: nucleotidyltransferase family protein, partial [Kiritimatiellae bacterium]|nr:nucleotidyltransferase family protein [Kiritimatiellia bacterium]